MSLIDRQGADAVCRAVREKGAIRRSTLQRLVALLRERTDYRFHLALEVETGALLKTLDNEADVRETIARLERAPRIYDIHWFVEYRDPSLKYFTVNFFSERAELIDIELTDKREQASRFATSKDAWAAVRSYGGSGYRVVRVRKKLFPIGAKRRPG
jgi:hypothetical protein